MLGGVVGFVSTPDDSPGGVGKLAQHQNRRFSFRLGGKRCSHQSVPVLHHRLSQITPLGFLPLLLRYERTSGTSIDSCTVLAVLAAKSSLVMENPLLCAGNSSG